MTLSIRVHTACTKDVQYLIDTFCLRFVSDNDVCPRRIQLYSYDTRCLVTKHADAEGVFWLQPAGRVRDQRNSWFTLNIWETGRIELKMINRTLF